MSAKPPQKHGSAPFKTPETFVAASLEPESSETGFDVITKRFVRIEVDGHVWIKRGTVIAYHGDLKFRRENVLQKESVDLRSGPARSALKRELVPLVKAEGKGILFVSDHGNHNQLVRLDGGSVCVVSTSLLAFEASLEHEVKFVGGVGLLAGGILMIKLSGHGVLALAAKGDPLTLRVTPEDPVACDPTAVLAWSGGLWPELKTDLELRNLIAHGGGAAIQMLFRGDGYVVVHARSEMEAQRANVVKRTTSKVRAFVK